MADTKISALTALTGAGVAADDALAIVDTSVTTTKKIDASELKIYMSASPTLVTPNIGTPSAGTLTSCTGLPISTGVSGLGTGIATALAVNTGSAGAPVLLNGALGTPSSGTLTNCTGYPASGSSGQIQYNNAGSFGGMSGTSWDDTNRALTMTGATITANSPLFTQTQTWNNAAVSFDAQLLTITPTAKATTNHFYRAKWGASDAIRLLMYGDNPGIMLGSGTVPSSGNTGMLLQVTNQTSLYYNGGQFGFLTGGNTHLFGTNARFTLSRDFQFSWSGTANDATAAADTFLTRAAAATVQFGAADAAAPVAQTITAQSVVAGTSNTAGVDFSLKLSAGTGSGTGGKFIIYGAPSGAAATTQNTKTAAWGLDGQSLTLYPAASLATNMTQGFINIPGAAGAPSGTPANTTGFPMYYDSTNNKIYVYNGSWRSTAALT